MMKVYHLPTKKMLVTAIPMIPTLRSRTSKILHLDKREKETMEEKKCSRKKAKKTGKHILWLPEESVGDRHP
jgi:hypothetical protein